LTVTFVFVTFVELPTRHNLLFFYLISKWVGYSNNVVDSALSENEKLHK